MAKYIIDTDTASDDAVALAMALKDPSCKVAAITVVAGNVPLQTAVRNALITLDMVGGDDLPPVYVGAEKPLIGQRLDASHIHGQDGLGDIGYPDPVHQPEKEGAVQAMLRIIDTCDEDIELITLGPLTNVAIAITLEPAIMKKLRRITVMGGSQLGYGSPRGVSEFNILSDPEAAQIVCRFGVPITMVPLEVCKRAASPDDDCRLSAAEMAAIKDIGTDLARFCIDCNKTLIDYNKKAYKNEVLGLADPTAVAAALRPGLIKESFACNIQVDTSGSRTHGQTNATRLKKTIMEGMAEHLTHMVVKTLDGPGFKTYLYDMLKR